MLRAWRLHELFLYRPYPDIVRTTQYEWLNTIYAGTASGYAILWVIYTYNYLLTYTYQTEVVLTCCTPTQ